MAIENNLQLISYLATAEIYDKGENIFDCFLPIIESALIFDDGKQEITFLRLQNKLNEIYHLNVPKSTLRKLLITLNNQKKIKFLNNRKITLYKDELNKIFWNKREERENLIEDFFFAFNDFLINNMITISLSEIKRGTCEWLYTHSLELANFINNGIFENEINDYWEYSSQLVSFLIDIQSTSSEHFKTFLLLYNGAVQSSLLNFETEKIETVCDLPIPFENIILDTNFILRMLNLQSEFDCSVAKETINTLKSINAKFYILDQTLTEVQNSIRNYLQESEPYTSYTQKYFKGQYIKMSGFWEASRRGISRTNMFENTKKENLKNNILELIDVTFIDDFDDTQLFDEQISSLVSSKNRDTYGDRQAKHDLSLLEFCKKNRKKHISSVQEVNWWVLTNDERLTFWNQQNCNEYQECLTEIQLSNLMWIQGNKNDNLGLTQTIVSLSTNTSITYNDIEQFVNKVHLYQQKHKNNLENLDKISILFSSNMLTNSDIQRINAEDDALDQMIEERVLEIQEHQESQQQQNKKILSENELLIQKNRALSVQLKKSQYERRLDKYKQDLSILQFEQENINNELIILNKINDYKNKHEKSSGRTVIILGLVPIIIIIILYLWYGYPFTSTALKRIGTLNTFIQDIIILALPILFTFLYYIIIGVIYGNLFSPGELFDELKQKLLNQLIRRYIKKNNIDSSCFKNSFEFEISERESKNKIDKRKIKIIQDNIDELNEKINLLDAE